jgi:hypothetical protein
MDGRQFKVDVTEKNFMRSVDTAFTPFHGAPPLTAFPYQNIEIIT